MTNWPLVLWLQHRLCVARYHLGLGIKYHLDADKHAQCVRCGYVYRDVTYDLPEHS